MAAAFAIFWDHRYRDLKPAQVFGEPKLPLRYPDPIVHIVGTDFSETEETYPPRQRVRTDFTPLEVFGHFVLFDPPHRDDLNLLILRVLHWYHQSCLPIRQRAVDFNNAQEFTKYQQDVYEADIRFFRFVTTQFPVGAECLNLIALTRAFPLRPGDPLWDNQPRGVVRAPLNGAALVFGYFWFQSEFYSDDFGITNLGRVPDATMPDKVAAAIESDKYFVKADMILGERPPAQSRSPPARAPLLDRSEPPPPEASAVAQSQKGSRTVALRTKRSGR
jgi:hypothetical protein